MKKRMSFLSIIRELLTSKDQHGFSLAEVMVAAGMMGALSLVVVNLSQTANKTTKAMSQQVEIAEVHGLVSRSLSIESACSQTFSAPGVNVDAIGPTLAGLAIPTVYGKASVDNSTIPPTVTYPTVITSSTADANGDGKPDNQIGDLLGTINIQQITVENYVQSGAQPAAAPSGERYGTVDLRIVYRKGHTAAVDDNQVLNSTYGQVKAEKVIRGIDVVANTAGAIFSCRADSNAFLSSACEMFDGELLSSNVSSGYKCHNIKIFNTPNTGLPANMNSKFSLIVQHDSISPNSEGSLKAEGGLVVGSAAGSAQYTDDTVGPGQGNALIQNNLTVGSNGAYNATTAVGANGALVQGAFMVTGVAKVKPASGVAGDGYFAGGLTVGPSMVAGNTSNGVPGDLVVQNNATVQQDLNVLSDGNVQNSFSVGLAAPAGAPTSKANITGVIGGNSLTVTGGTTALTRTSDGLALSVTAGNATMTYGTGLATSTVNINAVKNSSTTVNLNSVSGYPIEMRNPTNPNFRVSNSGEITIYNGSGTAAGNIVTQIAAGSGVGYRPSYIYNMPTYSAGGLSSAQYNEVPNKRWVLEAVYNSLSDNIDKASLLNAVSNIAAQPFDAIMMAICDNIRVRTQATNGFATGSLSGANCQVDPLVCGDSTGQRCATHYTTHYNASGSLSVGSSAYVGGASTLNGAVTMNSTLRVNGAYIYAPGGYIRAATYVRGDSYVYGGTYVQAGGTAASGLSGICGAAGCATKFGRYACSGGGVVIGIANGHLVCARVGGGASSPVGI